MALLQNQLAQEHRTESEFEKLVLGRLLRAGYRVSPQYRVGHYRIDLVVEGTGRRRLAVECDGDRFHPIDKIADDKARQAVLKRIGWRFVPIRGSHFFRDPESAMLPVFEQLSQLGISPLGAEAASDPKPGSAASPAWDEPRSPEEWAGSNLWRIVSRKQRAS